MGTYFRHAPVNVSFRTSRAKKEDDLCGAHPLFNDDSYSVANAADLVSMLAAFGSVGGLS